MLLSGRGSNFAAIVRASRARGANFAVRLAISDRKDALGLKKAARFGIPAYHVDPKLFTSKAEYENEICALLGREGIDLVCLAGYMRLVGPALLRRYPGRILNIHPALLPSFPGLDAQGQALRHGVKVSGCTVHFVDSGTDTGPIIAASAGARAPGRRRGLAQPAHPAPGASPLSPGDLPLLRGRLANKRPDGYHG